MKKGIIAVLTAAFLLVALLLMGAFNFTKPRMLVLQSSDRESLTVTKMDEGIHRVLDKNRQPMSVRWHYLGIDTLPDEDHRLDAAQLGLRAIGQFDPDVVIAVDDEAQHYVMRRFAGRTRPKLVFAAIDQDPQAYGYVGVANVTGVVETLPLAAMGELLLQARQGLPARLAVLTDTSPTGAGQLKQVQAFNWAPHSLVAVHASNDFSAWQSAVKAMDGKADAVLVLSYNGLQTSPTQTAVVAPTDIISWLERHSKPLPLGTGISYVAYGGGLSVAPSARAMGEVASASALQWLKAKPGDTPPPITQSTHYSIAMRAGALRARNLALPSIYTEAARLEQLYYP